ncbi:MAG TPA: mercury transporter, partial [Flavobacteriaceae bacterium]|nr:mercury transporter [Flavobacteriaceae bacterium]
MGIVQFNKKASMGTAVFSAVSLKLCCWGPLLLTGVAGISGSSVYFSWLIALKPYLLAIAFLSLCFAFYQVY